MTAAITTARRPYRSPVRAAKAQATRRRVLVAAAAEFLARGYGGTTMRAIAASARVAVPTVEALFGTKARVLKAAIDVAIAGDDEPVAVLDRPWVAEALAAPTIGRLLAIAGRILADAQARSAGLVLAAFEGAGSDPDLAALAEQLAAQRLATAAWLVDALATRRVALHDDAVDAAWVLIDPAVFDRLTRRRGWTVERYERWIAQALERLLVAEPRRPDS